MRTKAIVMLASCGALLVSNFAISPAVAAKQCLGKAPTIVGDSSSETIEGTNGRDVIHGGGGDDEIHGLGKRDLICGGNGDDTIYGDGGADKLAGWRGYDNIKGGGGGDYDKDSGGGGGTPTPGAEPAGKIGVILPDTASSVRWETQDRPLLQKAFAEDPAWIELTRRLPAAGLLDPTTADQIVREAR